MKTIAVAEFLSSIFVLIALAGLVYKRERAKDVMWLKLSLISVFFFLIIDGLAYTLVGPGVPFVIRYIINFLAYTAGSVVVVCFVKYCEAYIGLRASLKLWTFAPPIILSLAFLVVSAILFFENKLVVYENGIAVAVNDYPVWVRLLQMIAMIYVPFAIATKRKSIGLKAVFLLGLYNLIPIIASIVSIFIKADITTIFSASALVLVATVLQQEEFREALETSNVESYRMSLVYEIAGASNWSYDIDAYGEVVAANYGIKAKDVVTDKYDDPMGWVKLLHPEDKDRAVSDFMAAVNDRSGKTPYETTYRIMFADDNYHQVKSSGRVIHHRGGAAELFGMSVDISDQIEKEHIQQEKLKEAEDTARLLGSVASTYRFAFAVDMAGSYFKVIRMDKSVKEALGEKDFKTYYEAVMPLNTFLHPDDKERMAHELEFDTIREKLKDIDSYDVEYRVIYNDATEWHEMNVTRIVDEEIAMGFRENDLEITKRHLEEERFNEYFGLYEVDIKTEMLKILIDSPYYAFSETGDPVPYSKAMETFANNQEGETKEFFLNLSNVDWVKNALSSDDSISFTYYSITAGNTWVNVTGYVTKRYNDMTPAMFALGFSFVSSDEAAREDMQRQLNESSEKIAAQQVELEKALKEAEVANNAKSDFLFNMSHDIRTPMNAIVGFTNIAMKDINNTEKALDSLEKVKLSSSILLNLINDVLDMSRIESGKVELHEEKYEMGEAFDTFRPAMESLAASKDIDLKFSIGEIRDRYVFADGPRFDRVLINIISNAIKYTPEGFVKVSAEQIETTEPGYGNYRFIVADSGVGMSDEFQKHMFEDFTREENSTTSGIQGTGLGLPLAKKLVNMMGGTISCVSTQGIGTTFTIDFPFRLQTEADIAGGSVESQVIVDVNLKDKKVLLVEDNELNREIATELLTDEGMIVETAENGQKAVNIVRKRGANYYDFILMDIQMPVMDGYEATKTIHRLMPELNTPIIALSANAFAEDKAKSIEAGMSDHIAKPIDIKELFGALSKFI